MRRPPVALLATMLAVLLIPAAAQAQAPRTVTSELDALLAAGAIDQAHHDAWAESYDNAKATLKKLHGVRRRQLAAVVANTRGLAAAGLLIASRAPLVFLTLQRNRAWWSEGPLLRYGQRMRFAGSQLLWQYYPGQGIQVQWLGSFGCGSGLFDTEGRDADLRALLDEALGLATPRAGGIAWESLFHFDHGAPPWVSGLTQGTAIQLFSKAAARLHEPRYFEAARSGLGIFRVAPPEGNDAAGRALFAAGEAQARVELPTFDTGAWSLYQPGQESDLGYHVLVRDFLRELCKRVPDPTLYCTEADRFTAYLRQPPVLALKSTFALARKPSKLVFTVNKVSTVAVTMLRKGRPVFTRSARFGYGRHAFAFRPRTRGGLVVRLRAVDLAGNVGAVAGRIAVRAR